MRAVSFLLLMSAGFCLGQKAPSPARGSQDLENAIALFQREKYREAREQLIGATRRNPASAEGFFYLGMAEFHLHNLPAAEADLRKAVNLDPKSTNALYNLGVLLLEQKKPGQSITYLAKANEIGPQTPELSANLIRAYLDAGRNDRALQLAQSAGRRFSSEPQFGLTVGSLLLSHGFVPEARTFLDKANLLMPGQPEIVLPLAGACIEQHDIVAAQAVLKSIGGNANDSAEYHYLVAQTWFLSGQKEQAMGEMNLAVKLDPQNPVYQLALGRYYQKYGDQQKALSVLEYAARLAPDLAEIPYSMAVSYFIADSFEQADGFVTRALRINPAFDRALFLLGIAKFATGKFAEAEASLAQAMKLNPKSPFYPCFYGMLLASENRVAEAHMYFQKALVLDSSYALAHYQLGRLEARTGKYEEARTELERAIALEPNLAEAYYQLGHTYSRLGEKEKADQALATFKKYRGAAYSERQEMLKQAQDAIKGQP